MSDSSWSSDTYGSSDTFSSSLNDSDNDPWTSTSNSDQGFSPALADIQFIENFDASLSFLDAFSAQIDDLYSSTFDNFDSMCADFSLLEISNGSNDQLSSDPSYSYLSDFGSIMQKLEVAQGEATTAASVINSIDTQSDLQHINQESANNSSGQLVSEQITTSHEYCSAVSEAIVTSLAQSPPGLYTTLAEMGGPVVVPMGFALDSIANFLHNSQAAQGAAKSSLESLCNNIASQLDDARNHRESSHNQPMIDRQR